MPEQEIIREFLVEAGERLVGIERELVELESRPQDAALLASIFRGFHTLKGNAGFLGLTGLQSLTHLAENLLNELRSGRQNLGRELASLLLETVDAAREMLGHIERTGEEGEDRYQRLRQRLAAACQHQSEPAQPGAGPVWQGPEGSRGLTAAGSAIRVDVQLLDRLMNLAGELVLARNQLIEQIGDRDEPLLIAARQRLDLVTAQLQEGIMRARMQPIHTAWERLPRLVRDLAAAAGKQIQLVMEGAGTELDRSIIEAIRDPLTHLVRNACDHGIEPPEERLQSGKPAQGRLTLRAWHENGQVTIEVADDGRGVDLEQIRSKAIEQSLLSPAQAAGAREEELINLLFLPGFTTCKQASSISGRGVGLDVVKNNVAKLGGTVELASKMGVGTTVRIRIPLTLAIMPGLVISAGGERFVIPQVNLEELLRLEGDQARGAINRMEGAAVFHHRGVLLPLVDLAELLHMQAQPSDGVVNIVVVRAGGRRFALAVDAIHDTQDIVVKSLAGQLKKLGCYAGATVLGDGTVVLILDVAGLARLAGLSQHAVEDLATPAPSSASLGRRFLLSSAHPLERVAVPLDMVWRVEEARRFDVELCGSELVLHYEGSILPLVPVAAVLAPGVGGVCRDPQGLQVVIVGSGKDKFGLLVDEVLDVVEAAGEVHEASKWPGVAGAVLIGGRVAVVLDPGGLRRQAGAVGREDLLRLASILRSGNWETAPLNLNQLERTMG